MLSPKPRALRACMRGPVLEAVELALQCRQVHGRAQVHLRRRVGQVVSREDETGGTSRLRWPGLLRMRSGASVAGGSRAAGQIRVLLRRWAERRGSAAVRHRASRGLTAAWCGLNDCGGFRCALGSLNPKP